MAPTVAAQKKEPLQPSYAWRMIEPLGLRRVSTIDTVPYDYAQRFVPSMVSAAYATTGNYGAEGINMIWTERPRRSDFFFRDALQRFIPTAGTMRFYNTRTPMTLLSYNTAGGRDNSQDHLGVTFSGNASPRLQIGALLDYVYSKGCYANQADKDLIWGLSGSYMGDRYELQTYYNHYNLLNKENGGITDILYITDPALVQGGVTKVDPKSIPTRLNAAHTRLVGEQLLVNNRFKLGFWDEKRDENDSVVSRTYIPVTSFIYTLKYTGSRHSFINEAKTETARKFFENNYITVGSTNDRTSYNSIENTVGVSLLEGFNKYSKFGLSGYLTYELNRYTQTSDSLRNPSDPTLTPLPAGFEMPEHVATENKVRVGGQLTKQRGSILRYDATAEFGIAGIAAGDMLLDGNIETRIPLPFDTVSVQAQGRFTNEATPYFMRNYVSNHFMWRNDFGKERRARLGGFITVPRSQTRIGAHVDNIQNYVYFGSDFLPVQHSGSVQVVSAQIHQNFRAGVLHWDNSVYWQATSDAAVLPLPKVALYSNLYIKARVATLFLQMGVDCNYYTSYYAPQYQPAYASFATQTRQKVGNYPFMNAYANFKLSKTRFYVMYSHMNQGWFSRNYFSIPDYPLNPSRLQLGVSVDFAN